MLQLVDLFSRLLDLLAQCVLLAGIGGDRFLLQQISELLPPRLEGFVHDIFGAGGGIHGVSRSGDR